MQSIKSFIQREVLAKRSDTAGVLVVYDPDRRYRELCLELAADNRRIVDARRAASKAAKPLWPYFRNWASLNTKVESLLVYVPARPPLTDEDKQRDPFSIYGVCGTVFPEGDGDEYLTLCLKAKPDHATEIRRIFAQDPNPSFAVIDAVGGGGGWPNLQALLNVESARDILFALLAPSPRQKESLKSQEAWVAEAKDLFRACLGLKLLTRGKTWASLADELWRFVLFSEFVFDLPGELPGTLADVPRAEVEGRPLVEDLCDRLRNDRRTQADYIDRAESIERELDLPGKCEGLKDLGIRDTFPFEDRSFFSQAVEAIQDADLDKVRQLLARRTCSVWIGRGENQARWSLLDAALSLIQACDDAGRQLPDQARSQETLIDFYVSSLREVDRLQREFEQNASDALDTTGGLDKVMAQAQGAYRGLAAKLQDLFVKHLEQSGWPPAGRLSTADVFDRWVAPRLQESGRRVAYLLIDALRYELGVALEKQLAEDGQVELQAAFAPLPTVTPVGMAALLPGAGQTLRLVNRDGHATPALGDVMLPTLTQRTEVLRTRYGQRFADTTLAAFVHGKFKLPDGVELLVIRSSTMDSHLESEPEMTLGLIYDSLKRIRVAIRRLRELGFQDVVIATDHGFFLNSHAEAGDVCTSPRAPGSTSTNARCSATAPVTRPTSCCPRSVWACVANSTRLPDLAPWWPMPRGSGTSTEALRCRKPLFR